MSELKKCVRKLRKLKLLNVALTGIPMNEGSIVTGTFMKSLETANTIKVNGGNLMTDGKDGKDKESISMEDITEKFSSLETSMKDISARLETIEKKDEPEGDEKDKPEGEETGAQLKELTKSVSDLSGQMEQMKKLLEEPQAKGRTTEQTPEIEVTEEAKKEAEEAKSLLPVY